MTEKTFEIELSRNNVTPAQFLAYIRSKVDNKGGRYVRSDLDLEYFKAGNDLNFNIHHKDPEVPSLLGVHEISVSRPYEMQTYIRYPNGACYNEICEFNFDDDKTGYGYYYLVNVNAIDDESFSCVAEDDTHTATADTTNTNNNEEENEMKNAEQKISKITAAIEAEKTVSAWAKGVKAYALEMLERVTDNIADGYIDESVFLDDSDLMKVLLNGARDWKEYSWGGCALIYDQSIAERLCSPSELKKVRNGERRPNSSEEWLDVQARALFQAAKMITKVNTI